ncbi:MAG TPA: serine/threonine-protein kinase [Polyangiaceae bacterium]|nr:serine/threonine-protein kinase [Polyangiaceae bacterium]
MPDPASPPVREGDLLAGKYRVERIIGSGGMGVVVAARHEQLDQLVALKFVRDEALGNQDAVQRFLREARAAVKLRSEHAAKVLDVGTLESGAPYMVMEFLEGRDLGQVLAEQGPIGVEAAAEWLVQTCEAVAEAHAAGIVHRDLKPQNLFLARSVGGASKVKVLDFGVSKSMTTSDGAGGLTQTRSMLGSPLYMSPEQMRSSRDVDARSDVWALGVVLYELLTRRWPFEAESMPELCLKVVTDPPTPIAQHRSDLPPAMVQIIDRCLQKDPALRYEHAAELAEALEPMAPPASHVIVERARMAMASTNRTTQPRLTSRNPEVVAQTAPTPAAWGSGRVASPAMVKAKRSPALWIGLGAVAAAAVAAVVVYAIHGADEPGVASTASAPVVSPSAVASVVAAFVATPPSASAPPEPAASDTAVAAASASAPARPPPTPPGSAKPDPTPRAPPTGRPRPVDDIPSLR